MKRYIYSSNSISEKAGKIQIDPAILSTFTKERVPITDIRKGDVITLYPSSKEGWTCRVTSVKRTEKNGRPFIKVIFETENTSGNYIDGYADLGEDTNTVTLLPYFEEEYKEKVGR